MRPLGLLGCLAVAGCGTFTLSPVYSSLPGAAVRGASEAPAAMLLLDRSASMGAPLAVDAGCACAYPGCDEAACPTRLGAVQRWGGRMLGELGERARWGLTTYPHDSVCGGPQASDVLTPIPAAPGAGGIAAQLVATQVGGGTPTAFALTFAGGFQVDGAERVVVLVTDGLPNCNASSLADCTQPAACRCTLSGGGCGTVVNDSDPGNFCRRGCLDEGGAVGAVGSLAAFGVFTLVVGLGPDFEKTDARGVLDAMSRAATDQVVCASDDDCFGAFACRSGRCEGPGLLAADEAGLDRVSGALARKLELSAKCRYRLDADVTAESLRVYFGQAPVERGQLAVEPPRRVRLLGAACAAARGGGAPSFRVEN